MAKNTADNGTNAPVVAVHAHGVQMNTIRQKDVYKSRVIAPEDMTTGDPLPQVVVNVPDRVAVLTSHPGKGEQLADDDDVTGGVRRQHTDELQQLLGDLAIGHVAYIIFA